MKYFNGIFFLNPCCNVFFVLACKPDHFKSTHDNSQCEKCPMNSKSEEGSAICNCNKGYYRAVNASAKAICDKPPRAPVMLVGISCGGEIGGLSHYSPPPPHENIAPHYGIFTMMGGYRLSDH